MKSRTWIAAASILALGRPDPSQAAWASDGIVDFDEDPPISASSQEAAAGAQIRQVCHDVSNLWLLVSNFGVFGLADETFPNPYQETCGHDGYISCQFPARGGYDYLFQGALWVGAIVGDDTLVSVGHDGWAHEMEFFPGSTAADSIVEYTNNPSAANYDSVLGLADQTYVAVYTDTLLTSDEPNASPNHRKPLNIEVRQTSHALTFSYAEDFVIFDYEIQNLGLKKLKDVFIGLYLDGDVGPTPQVYLDAAGMAQDDVTGFRKSSGGKPINAAWLADYDGPQYRNSNSGDAVLAPGAMGVRVVRSPEKQLRTTFNWWLSDTDQGKDWGPGRRFPDGLQGTPDGDINKYLILSGWQNSTLPDSNCVDADCTVKSDPGQLGATNGQGVAVGAEDTRFLFSFGPFQILSGETLPFTLGYFCAENFWRGGSTDEIDYTDFDINAQWVQFVFDNPGVDTPIYDYGEDAVPNTGDAGEGDGVLDTGDYFFGEDVGADGVPNTGDAGEGNGELDPGEDSISRYVIRWIDEDPGESQMDYLARVLTLIDWEQLPEQIMATYDRLHLSQEPRFGYDTEGLDEGDGAPDFNGPPPPPSPLLKIEKPNSNHLVVKWQAGPEIFSDGFIPEPTKRRDFQGYRVYVSRTGAGSDFTQLLDLDVDRVPVYDDSLNIVGYEPDSLGRNTGFSSIRNTDADSSEYPYRYVYGPTLENWPVYLAVTAYDNGYPPAKLASLESSVFINATVIQPNNPLDQATKEPVRVVPNPYKITTDYTGGWEKSLDQWTEFDRRIDFTNLPGKCRIRVYTLAGDVVEEFEADPGPSEDSSASWDLISRNGQAIVSGLYLFSVEPAEGGDIEVGKFVVIK